MGKSAEALQPAERSAARQGRPGPLHWASSGRRRPLALAWLDESGLEGGLLGLFVGLAVTAPWLPGGWTFLLDWGPGPRTPVVGPGLLGLNGGLTTGALGAVGFGAMGRLVGPALTWLAVLAVFVVGAAGVSRLVGGPRSARLPAVALYCLNPFVFNRIYAGHLGLLAGYALLAFTVTSALQAPAAGAQARSRPHCGGRSSRR